MAEWAWLERRVRGMKMSVGGCVLPCGSIPQIQVEGGSSARPSGQERHHGGVSGKGSLGTRKLGFWYLLLFQLTVWDLEKAKTSLGLRIFICKMGNHESFPGLKPYVFIFTGGCSQPNITLTQVIYHKPATFNRCVAGIFKTCNTWPFSQGHWPLFPKIVRFKKMTTANTIIAVWCE